MSKPEPILFLDDHRGVYIPRDFANSVQRELVTGITDEQYADLENPDSETYWDTWTEVCDSAVIQDGATKYSLYQDGALWLIPDGMEWDDKTEFYVWPDTDRDNVCETHARAE